MENKTNDSVEVSNIKIDEPLHWEGLVQIRKDLVTNVIEQQALVLELAKKYEEILKKDTETSHALNGLMLTIQDLATNIAEITKEHQDDNGNYFTGIAEGDDAILDYLRIASTYISIEENLANLIATAYLDVFTKLTTDTSIINDIKKIIEDMKNGE